MFADSHIHLDRYTDEEAAVLLARARQANVTHFLTVGVDLDSSEQAILLARQHSGLAAAVGLHPSYLADDFSSQMPRYQERLCSLAQRSTQVVAIGEAGIDLLEARAPLEAQRQAFRLQVHLAYDLKLPLVLHQQAAEAPCQDILQAAAPDRGETLAVIVHYFV